MAKETILIVDDEQGVRDSLQGILEDEGFQIDAVPSAEAGLAALDRRSFDLVLLDVWMEGMDGIEALERINQLPHPPATVMISGHSTIETAVRATKLGAYDFIEKPLSLEKILLVVKNACKQRRLEQKHRLLHDEWMRASRIVGESPALQELRAQIAMAAPSNGRVLIMGENGTGKELVARNIHLQSQRAHEPFVEINCAAIPEELIESELFGHLKGSFTGAVEDKQGKFELADQGTLFFDEVGDMSLVTQAKVLRVLQEQRFTPVGGKEQISVDVRVIAATNKHLQEEIANGTFREDLFFRLNVLPISIPPLRERTEDIPLLVHHFLDTFCREYKKPIPPPSPEAIATFAGYPWPGNVRELRNVVERLVIMTQGDQLDLRHFPALGMAPAAEEGPDGALPLKEFASLKEARDFYEKEYIRRIIDQVNGNMSEAARKLGMDRSSLYRRMKHHQLRAGNGGA